MNIAQTVLDFLQRKGARVSLDGNSLNFEDFPSPASDREFSGWVEFFAEDRYAVTLGIARLEPKIQEFIRALPEYAFTLFFAAEEDEDGTQLLMWRSGRQYAGSTSGLNRALDSLFFDAEIAANGVLDLLEARIRVSLKRLGPRDFVALCNNWQGEA